MASAQTGDQAIELYYLIDPTPRSFLTCHNTTKFADQSKLKGFADGKINVTKKVKMIL